MMKDNEKNNLENTIFKKINNDKMEINNSINNVIKRIDNFDIDFDRLIQSLKTQFIVNANTISQLDLSKINIKILNELKNQADDIKILYQKMNIIDNTQNKQRDINFESPKILSLNSFMNQLDQNENPALNNILSIMENELAKKANLDLLNFALESQSKLNEAFSSASRISRFCWDSEGLLKDDKYIIWTIQNINTALDVFKWENNSENITIMQNGVYKIVIGLIGLEKNKNFGIINDDENIIVDSRNNNNGWNEVDNENDINNDKGNIKFMEKYIACVENTKIRAIIFDNNNNNDSNEDNSEEAFLEIIKII